MKLYKTVEGIIIEDQGKFYRHREEWDGFINDDHLYAKVKQIISEGEPLDRPEDHLGSAIQAPVHAQELWACGVTYLRSKLGRQEESKAAGGGDFYGRVYEAERPEIFFKCTNHRIVPHKGHVKIRKDSSWDVPEPELTLVVTSLGKIVGYTVGNDMSSRSIEGENPLYLPQAKTYDGCASVGPCILVTENGMPEGAKVTMEIYRNGSAMFEGNIGLDQMKRTPKELVSFVYRECSFPHGALIMTGTGIVPSHDFTLRSGDEIRITIDHIGTLINYVG